MAIITPSGTVTFEQTRNQIVTNAMLLVGALGAEDSISSWDLNFGVTMFEMMVKAWQAKGLGLWKTTEASLFLTPGVNTYSIGGTNSAHTGANAIITTLSSTAALGANSLSVTTTTGSITTMAINDIIGIVLDTGTIQWTTITSVSGTTIGIAATLTSQASSGANVYDYAVVMNDPINITQVRLQLNSGLGVERELVRMSREEYRILPNKALQTKPSRFFYDAQLNNGSLIVYPTPDSSNDIINYTYKGRINDIGSSLTNPDFPKEWLLALTYGVAKMVAPAYGKDQKLAQGFGATCDQLLADAKGFDIDEGSVFIMPDQSDNN